MVRASIRGIAKAERTERARQAVYMSFDLFCEECVKILDSEALAPIPFRRYDCQKSVSDMLVDGKWPIILKARQLGMTWLVAVYTLWKLLSRPMFVACVTQQNRDYAKDFLDRTRFIYGHLPVWLKTKMGNDSRYELVFDHPGGQASQLRVIAGGTAAGRSMTPNLMVFDEHAYTAEAQASREGSEPGIRKSKGQIVVISTSAGPFGDFHAIWEGAPDNGYEPVFLRWDEDPARDVEWYEEEAGRHSANPMYMPREYPKTATEAFLHAEGRCYPSFDEDRHVRTLEELGLDLTDADLYRAIDFGQVAAFACLWIAHFQDGHPSLTVDPSCRNLIREMICYHFDERNPARERPVKVDDHACFVAGTKVETLEGPQAIETIRIGQFVRSHRGWTLVEVGATSTGFSPVVRLTLEGGAKATCTPDHPFALASGGFARADEVLGCNAMVWIGDHGIRTKELAFRRGSRMEIADGAEAASKRRPTGTSWLDIIPPAERRKLPPVGFEKQKVVGVESVPGCGLKVYTMATADGTYLANGILVSNCDALRYGVVQYAFTGHVHVYRELYVKNSVAKRRTDLHDIRDIHEMSGWEEAPAWATDTYRPGRDGEQFMGTVADKASPKSILQYCEHNISCEPYTVELGSKAEGDVIDGIKKINELVDATIDIRKRVVLTPELERERLVRRRLRGTRHPQEASASLQESAIRDIVCQKQRKADKARSERNIRRRYRPYGVAPVQR